MATTHHTQLDTDIEHDSEAVEYGEEIAVYPSSSDTTEMHRSSITTLVEKSRFQQGQKRESFVFDIETGPLPFDHLQSISEPFTAPAHPGQFDPRSVAVGHLKDPAKIAAKIAQAEFSHAESIAHYETNCMRAEAEYWKGIIDKAAMSPITGCVLAIGIGFPDGDVDVLTESEGSEEGLLADFWCGYVHGNLQQYLGMVGHNIKDFDLPFLIRRSWMLGVDVPEDVFDGRYLNRLFVDTREYWKLGSRADQSPSSLDAVCRALSIEGKLDGVSGADFAKLYESDDPAQRQLAMDYLERDVLCTLEVAKRLGVI